MQLDSDHCYRVVQARDARFDGVFFVGVSTTGIYCRPICTVRTPGRDRCSFFANAAGAEAAGFRPCLRCRPELAPGRAPVDSVKRVADAAVTRIEAGALANNSLEELAAEFAISSRQLRRVIESEYGVTPLAIAQTRRLLLAKQLLTDTPLRVIDIAFASGFASVRQFNRQFRAAYRMNPTAIRQRRATVSALGVPLHLGYRPPLAWNSLVGFLAGRGASTTESCIDDTYVRTVRLGTHTGWIAARPVGANLLRVEVAHSLLPVLPELQLRLRRLFDLDANPTVIDLHLSSHERLAAMVKGSSGLRLPGAFDGFELALRAVLGQQISVKAATTIFGRFVATFGTPVKTPFPTITHLAPTAECVADATLQQLIGLGLHRKRAETVSALSRAVVAEHLCLQPPADAREIRVQLRSLPGIGAWTAEYIAMRALGDPDAFPHSDLGLLRALNVTNPKVLQTMAEAWRPWRAYAAMHLWHAGSRGG